MVKFVVRRNISQIPWTERMIKKASVWRRRSKEIMANNAIQIRNRHGGNFDWDNDDMSALEVTTELLKMIHPDMVANLPGIKLEIDFLRQVLLVSGKNPYIITQLESAILNAGLDEEPEANIDPIRVIETPDINLRDDMYPGLYHGQGVLLTIEEEQEILPEFSDYYDDDSNDNIVYKEDEDEDIPEPVVQRTRSG